MAHRMLNRELGHFNAYLVHSDEDEVWANHICETLEEDFKKTCCLRNRDFPAGFLELSIIEHVLRNSDVIILMITENFLHCGWCQLTWQALWGIVIEEEQDRQTNPGLRGKMVPLVKGVSDLSKIPPCLRVIHSINVDKHPDYIQKLGKDLQGIDILEDDESSKDLKVCPYKCGYTAKDNIPGRNVKLHVLSCEEMEWRCTLDENCSVVVKRREMQVHIQEYHSADQVEAQPEIYRSLYGTCTVQKCMAKYTFEASEGQTNVMSFMKNETFQIIMMDKNYKQNWWLVMNPKTKDLGFVPKNLMSQELSSPRKELLALPAPNSDQLGEQIVIHSFDRRKAKKYLKKWKKIGGWLLRWKGESNCICVLDVLISNNENDKRRVRHYQIISNDENKFQMPHGSAFKTLEELVGHYCSLPNGLQVELIEQWTSKVVQAPVE